jgi:late competence protein required for DNA uptake (superfamily II DNA/RNA helicase)
MFLMKERENRDGTLEVQEELFSLEREKTIALENALVIKKRVSRCNRTCSTERS